MRNAVLADKARAVNSDYHMKMLHSSVMYKLVIAPLKERRIYGENRHHTASCKPRGKGYGVFFGYADIIKSVGKLLSEFFKTRAERHSRGYSAYTLILRGYIAQEIAELGGKIRAAVYGLARIYIEF